MATKRRAGGNATSSATTGIDHGEGAQEALPMVGPLKTPVFHAIKVGRGGARNK